MYTVSVIVKLKETMYLEPCYICAIACAPKVESKQIAALDL